MENENENENTSPTKGNKRLLITIETYGPLKYAMDEEIMPRLPVKSILRFRCVSKAWRAAIGGRRFINRHLEVSANNQLDYSAWRVIFHCKKHGFNQHGKGKSSLRSYLTTPDLGISPIDDPKNIKLLDKKRVIVDSCDGVLCVYKKPGQRFFLWNPATRVTLDLPRIELEKLKIRKLGFGRDEMGDGYKVFVGMTVGDESVARVYNGETETWGVVQHGGVPRFKNGSFVCGRFHWVIKKKGKEEGYIETFDLRSEVFGRMELPCKEKDDDEVYLLREIEGCLWVVYVGDKRNTRSVWVMKEYGVKESWVLVFSELRNRSAHWCCKPSVYIPSLISPILQ